MIGTYCGPVPMVNDPVSAVQVGLGGWGTDWALRVLPSAPGMRVVAWAEPDPARRAAFAEATGVPLPAIHSGLDAAMAEVDAEAVFVTTAPATRGAVTRAALSAGKHVLLEKPFTLDLAEAADLVHLADEVGRRLVVAQDHRFFAASSQVRHLLAQEVVGQVRHVSVSFRRNHRSPAEDTCSVLWRTAVHHFDLLRAFFGEPRAIDARAWPCGRSRDAALTSFSAEIEFRSGVVVQYSASADSSAPATPWTGDWTVEGDDGMLHWAGSDPAEGAYARYARAGGEPTEVPVGIPHLRDRWAVIAHFARAVRAGCESEISGRATLGTVALVSAAETSLTTGRSVTLG
ncbi:oxidoreductase [Actinokineospora fastidiosa]|uniref:Oxidoreductase n=2 Tax=Actinokineospora fastidiosa TaxID=1816 RepID=A0A918GN02_9PSEU|nr:oxidoreductase [Actinokineospora fastidiosa]